MPFLSTYFSVAYLALLLPGFLILYSLLPQKPRRLLLLLGSYFIYWLISGKLLVYLLLATTTSHYTGLWLALDKEHAGSSLSRRRQGQILAFGIIQLLGMLLLFKYGQFFTSNLNRLFTWLHLPFTLDIPNFLLPVGISFYTLQAISYLVDVYRGVIPAESNLLRFALYMSFFPQLMEGPICRYRETASQLWEAPPLRWNRFVSGAQRILWGLMKKMVVADRLNSLIQTVFSDYQSYDGLIIALAAVCYTIQLYMEFSGTLDLVIGSGEILGIRLPENFNQPFSSKTIAEFWRRWHITLGSWFRDYIFYPLSLSSPLKRMTLRLRKVLGSYYGALPSSAAALLCVWLCNGLWHGAGWHYLFFGLYHFSLILCGKLIEPAAAYLSGRLHIDRSGKAYRCFQVLRTSLLVCIGELFFRAHGLTAGLEMFRKIITEFSFHTLTTGAVFSLGLDKQDFLIVLLSLCLVAAVSHGKRNGFSPRDWLAEKPLLIRMALPYLLVLYIIVFGAYGEGYTPVDPIYAAF